MGGSVEESRGCGESDVFIVGLSTGFDAFQNSDIETSMRRPDNT
jgi:hypothetical protein